MTNNQSIIGEQDFNPIIFIDDLVEAMGMQNQDEESLKKLKQSMMQALYDDIMQAAMENLEPEIIEATMEKMQNEKDPVFIIQEMLTSSPAVHKAAQETLEEFKKNTMEVFRQLSNNQN